MSASPPPVKSRWAPLKNLAACYELAERLITRSEGRPGIGVFYGPSGYGKTEASIYAQNKTKAFRIEVGESWNGKSLLEAILLELGAPKPKGTIATLQREAINRLGDDPTRPLIIDEADKLIKREKLELVREMHMMSQAPVLLIGEEMLPAKMLDNERLHNRVLSWVPAQECDIEDARKLAAHCLGKLTIDEATLAAVCKKTQGRARRLVTTFDEMVAWARVRGKLHIDVDYDGPVHTGRPPDVRKIRYAA